MPKNTQTPETPETPEQELARLRAENASLKAQATSGHQMAAKVIIRKDGTPDFVVGIDWFSQITSKAALWLLENPEAFRKAVADGQAMVADPATVAKAKAQKADRLKAKAEKDARK